MNPSHHHAEGLEKLKFNYALSVKYFSKFRVNRLEYLEKKLCLVPSFQFAYGCTETSTQYAFRKAGEKGNKHYHILVLAGENFEKELIEVLSGDVSYSERDVLAKLNNSRSETGFQDDFVKVSSTTITTSGSEYFLEKPINITSWARYIFKAASRGVVTFFIKKV